MRARISWAIFFIILFGCLGYMREFFFVHINNIMYMKYYDADSALQVPDMMKLFEQQSYDWLYYAKYPFTAIWAGIFLLANYYALKKLSGIPVFTRILFISYLLILVLAAISMAYGFFVNSRLQDDEYTLSRWLLRIAQSPLICLILLASEKLYIQSIGKNTDKS